MKIKVEKEDLLNGLISCQGVLSPRSTLPILSYYLFNVKGDNISISATDLEVGIEVKIPGQIVEEGVITLPGKKVFDLVREFPSGVISIFSEGNFVTFKQEKIWAKINYLSPDDFPNIPEVKGMEIKINGSTLKRMVKRTSFAVSHEETQYILNGIYVTVFENLISMVSTDTRRLSCVTEEITLPSSMEVEAILPLKACLEVSRIMKDEPVVILWGEKQIKFSQPGVSLTTRIIEGEFPDYKVVIPRTFKTEARINKEELKDAVKRAYIMTREKSLSMKLKFQDSGLLISTRVPDAGESSEEVNVELQGESIEISFDPVLILDVLNVIDDDTVIFGVNGVEEPGLIKPAEGEGFLYVVMPMKI
ncbi:MAG: DNA polymerase III subunit beta [Caldiserica bacterium]|nr:DNA polymerase III subunit beta [Caldisericota bacterium]